ncbi:HAD family hydrolase [Salinibaculum rarum]|uniref:HAD family hydrolase n=1 Tax=Salinibaculum rarum TaxID=3058903 RepID=UPI00265FBBBF|nr:HAD-IA family hydrolase [Salinibaculum sp. KK48]
MDYDAIIFDNDGVLVTPTDRRLWHRASQLAFHDLGVTDVADTHLDRLDGYSLSGLVRTCERYGVNSDEFWQRREAHAARAQRHEIRAGRKHAYDDVDILQGIDPSVGIVSNNQQETIDFLVDHFGFDDAVETQYGREPSLDGLVRMKPNSHYLHRAIRDPDATNPLYVGDSGVDMAAAADLGIDSAFVRRPHRTNYDPRPTATYELSSLADLRTVCRTVVA